MAQLAELRQDQTNELSEISGDYELLILVIDQWVEENCDGFLSNRTLKYDQWQDTWRFRGLQEDFERVLSNYYKQLGEWAGAKQHVLNALIMRYIFDYILTSSFPPWLSYENQKLLVRIEENMNNLEPKKDIYHLRSWRRDTVLSILCPSTLIEDRAQSEIQLANGLYNIIRNALPNCQGNRFVDSLRIKIIKPSIELAQKVQSSLDIWTFSYSPYWTHPGQYASHLLGFLDSLTSLQCINIADQDSLLTSNVEEIGFERRALIYLQDIYPGLYRQEVNPRTVLPVVTVTPPLLIVTFQ